MSISVYFKSPDRRVSLLVAEVEDEEVYETIEPFLSALASAEGYIITETVH